MDKLEVGLIGYLSWFPDFWEGLDFVAKLGFKGIEGGEHLLKGDRDANLERFNAYGLKCYTVSTSVENVTNDIPTLINKAKALKADRVTCWWSPASDYESTKRDAKILDNAGKALASEGLKLCYHNHDHEFTKTFNGSNAFDIILNTAKPENLYIELDIGWATMGGMDIQRLIRQLKGRLVTLHMKDFADKNDRNSFTAVGTGIVDMVTGMKTALEIGLDYIVIEQDVLRNLDVQDTLSISYLNLKESGLIL